jgi:hypothetical protein
MSRRTFETADLVALPRVDAAGAVALAAETLTLAKAVDSLPPLVRKRVTALERARAELSSALARRAPAATDSDAIGQREADQAADAAWSATLDFLRGWARLPSRIEERDIAQALLAVLYPDGLKFTQLPFKQQWAEAAARIDRIKKEKLSEQFRALGGEAFLKQLDATHKAYGAALGITKEKPAPEAAPTLLEPLREVQTALRRYVVAVAASVDEDDEVSAALADKLLAPLRNWGARADKAGSKIEPAPAPPPNEPAPGEPVS